MGYNYGERPQGGKMAKITIDDTLCTGCGLCAASCPEVFEVQDDNLAHIKSARQDKCDLAQVASECPVGAIIVG
jgi:ferredoxin